MHRWSWREIIPKITSNENCDRTNANAKIFQERALQWALDIRMAEIFPDLIGPTQRQRGWMAGRSLDSILKFFCLDRFCKALMQAKSIDFSLSLVVTTKLLHGAPEIQRLKNQ